MNTEAAVAHEKHGTTAEALGHNAPASDAFYTNTTMEFTHKAADIDEMLSRGLPMKCQ